MPRQIWIGPVLGSNRPRLVARCADLIADDQAGSFLYLTASHPLLEIVTRDLLDGSRNRGVWGSIPVHLFRGLVRHVLSTAVEEDTGLPLQPLAAIDREELPLKRSLLSQLIKHLAAAGKIKAIAPLAHRDGCIDTIASLIGEIQRAAKTPVEFHQIVDARVRDSQQAGSGEPSPSPPIPRQVDFDRDVSLIYSAYASALARFRMTDDDADQLRALEVLRGETGGKRVASPWSSGVRLLVLDGFFDFTPVQGEMLRLLIPQIPDVIVTLNRDDRNREAFRPFSQTIDQLSAIAEFEIRESVEAQPVAAGLAGLRARLFNPAALGGFEVAPEAECEPDATRAPGIRLLECSDRETEIRAIAKEIKRLVLVEGYSLADMALVVRERAVYAEAIARILDDESIPCNPERRVPLVEVPAVRAAMKLFQVLGEMRRSEAGSPKVSDLAGLVKSEYLRLPAHDLAELSDRFARDHGHLLTHRDAGSDSAVALGIGRWDADSFENVVAYVGSELRADKWLERARRLTASIETPPQVEAADEADVIVESSDEDEAALGNDETVRVRDDEPSRIQPPGSLRRPRLSTEIHPALIAWTGLAVERLAHIISRAPEDGRPINLRGAVMALLEQLQFADQIKRPLLEGCSGTGLIRAALDLSGLEGMRRGLAAAIRAVEIAEEIVPERQSPGAIKLTTYLDEAIRCFGTQVLNVPGADRDGLQVLEATDVRGLRFRAVFIAGLVEGGFPLRASRDWIYPHEERERLKQYGLNLEDISPDTLLKEEHYFYQAACRATERLYLSRPLLLEENADAEAVASYYVDEIRRAVLPMRIESEIVRRDFDGAKLFEASTRAELSASAVRQDERHRRSGQREGLLPRRVVEEILAWAVGQGHVSQSALERIDIERERDGLRFGRFDGEIANADLLSLMRDEYGGDHVFSASELSLYGKCPFKFFAQRVLKLEPRGEAALDLPALDAGRLLHEVLKRFFERHRMEQLASRDRDTLRSELQAAADLVFDRYERATPPLNPQVWKIDREIRKVLLDQVLAYEISVQEATRKRDVRPAYFELAFGMKSGESDPSSTEELLELRRPGGEDDRPELARFRGQIDRVDIAADMKKDGAAIAYDYKLSRGATISDMKEGRDLQLGIYLAALEQLFLRGRELAGGGYYVMRGGQDRRNRGLYRTRYGDYTAIGATKSNLSDGEWSMIRAEMETRVWDFIDAMREGRFLVTPSSPKDTCPTCDYSAVCRYEKIRISHKAPREEQTENGKEVSNDLRGPRQ